ncbi:acetyltransferase [Pseudodesulfovibrio cashew]|uniref:Acetyltransferase n=1 Tax=Pseudodesulfovibrio cashew TaxID=2678688 RepID=A0A6I6JR97_9BACT|nr:acetyltransferase [Pseudodesulfovibrio cashew]QGY40124.1 acetyltransferase [Pseudodesulfovibrio cashew]
MQILPASKNDYPEILDVWEASVRATHDFLTEEAILYFKPLILNTFLDAVELLCARDERGAILGFMGVAEESIEMLFIAPDSRGTGIGKALLSYGIEELKATRVDVNEQNPQALEFYEHMGFEVVGRSERDGMGKPYPLLHMKLRDND